MSNDFQNKDQTMSSLVEAMGKRTSYNLVHCSFYLLVMGDLSQQNTKPVSLAEIRQQERMYFPKKYLLTSRQLRKYLKYMERIDLLQIFNSGDTTLYQLRYYEHIDYRSKRVLFQLLHRMYPNMEMRISKLRQHSPTKVYTPIEMSSARSVRRLFKDNAFWNNIYYFMMKLDPDHLPDTVLQEAVDKRNKYFRLKRKFMTIARDDNSQTIVYDGTIIEKTVTILDKILIPYRRE